MAGHLFSNPQLRTHEVDSSLGTNNCRMNRKSLFVLQHNSDEFIPISSDYTSINEFEYTLNSMPLVSYVTNRAYNQYI